MTRRWERGTDSVTEVSAGSLACFTAVQITENLHRRGKFVSFHPVSQHAPCSPFHKQTSSLCDTDSNWPSSALKLIITGLPSSCSTEHQWNSTASKGESLRAISSRFKSAATNKMHELIFHMLLKSYCCLSNGCACLKHFLSANLVTFKQLRTFY